MKSPEKDIQFIPWISNTPIASCQKIVRPISNSIFLDTVFISSKKRIITPKSIAQKLYIDAIQELGYGLRHRTSGNR